MDELIFTFRKASLTVKKLWNSNALVPKKVAVLESSPKNKAA